MLTALYPFGVGGAGIVFPERTTPERIFELITEHRPTILVNVPTMMAQMIDTVSMAGARHQTCPVCGCARRPARRCRASCTAPLARHVRSRGAGRDRLVRAVPHLHLEPAWPSTPREHGRARAGLRTEVGENGELLVTGDTAALLYWGDDEQTKRTFSGDTVRTGDLFERDDDGFFWYRGRVDDLIKVGGMWVAPAEIEHCLVGHPEVVECAVVGAQRNGLTVPRALTWSRGAPLEEQAVQDFVRERLSPHKYPREVRFVDDLPKTPSGKIDRKALA